MNARRSEGQQQQQQKEQHQNHHSWTLPCHFNKLSLMNCKSKAEAFARSLQNKLQSLGRSSGERNPDDDEDSKEASSVKYGIECGQVSSTRKAGNEENDGGGCSSEKSHLMMMRSRNNIKGKINGTTVPSSVGEDELYFDFDITTPDDSPAEERDDISTARSMTDSAKSVTSLREEDVNKYLVTEQPQSIQVQFHQEISSSPSKESSKAIGTTTEDVPCDNPISPVDVEGIGLMDGESGCISAVSSIFTDNGDDYMTELDEDYWDDSVFNWSLVAFPPPPPSSPPDTIDDQSDNNHASFSHITSLPPIVERLSLDATEDVPLKCQDEVDVVCRELFSSHDDNNNDDNNNIGADSLITKVECSVGTSSTAAVEIDTCAKEKDINTDVENELDVTKLSSELVSTLSDVGFRREQADTHTFLVGSDDLRIILNKDSDVLREEVSLFDPNTETSCQNVALNNDFSEYNVFSDTIPVILTETVNEREHLDSCCDTATEEHAEGVPLILAVTTIESCCSYQSCKHAGRTTDTNRIHVNITVPPNSTGFASNDDDLLSPNDDSPHRVQRSSSLKTGKTPPGTPIRKKIVRFADALGLDLEAVKTVFLDDLPTVPSSAYNDLQASAYSLSDDATPTPNVERFSPFSLGQIPRARTVLVPLFSQPGCLMDFLEKVRRQSVCLESAVAASDTKLVLVVRVLNLDFHKSVLVRYTSNDWLTYEDKMADYVEESCDGFSDKFQVCLNVDFLQVGERLALALRYVSQNREYWDSNNGQNYVFQCFVQQDYRPSPPDESWIHFL